MSRKHRPASRPQNDKVAREVTATVARVQGIKSSGAAGVHRDGRDQARGTKSSRGGRQASRRQAISQAW